jgi:hypothetical protein
MSVKPENTDERKIAVIIPLCGTDMADRRTLFDLNEAFAPEPVPHGLPTAAAF